MANHEAQTIEQFKEEYRVLRQIANGAFGSVHCVQRRDTKVIQAAKYVKSRYEDFQREVDCLKRLNNSPLILKFVSFYSSKSVLQSVLITEFLSGGDLCERTSAKDYVLTEHKCRVIVRQIVRGVRFIHAANIIHLDLKPFNVVFSQKKDDYDLRIIDFGLARQLPEGESKVRLGGMYGTIEYMSPEVMDCTYASAASDCWGIGVITYQLLSGGLSPFFAVNRFRTMARVLDCDYSLEAPELKVSCEAKDFVSRLLQKDGRLRMDSEQCLSHPWLKDDKPYFGILDTLETTWMRRCLARRRWYRLLNTVRAMSSMRQFVSDSQSKAATSEAASSDDEETNGNNSTQTNNQSESSRNLIIGEFNTFNESFLKLQLLANNGPQGTLFSIQEIRTGNVFTAKYLKRSKESSRKEAEILRTLRNDDNIIAFHGYYESQQVGVIVTDFLVGGDLVEHVARSDFVLNEAKCKSYLRQICSGVSFIHACNIVHLDIKPFSVLFSSRDDDAALKITDFGLASVLPASGEGIRIKEICGSLEFVSPEVLDCTRATTATDCWGIGVIAYMLISGGHSPFYAGNRFRTMAKIVAGYYDLNFKHVTPDAKDFIKGLLILEPKERRTAKSCLKHAWLTNTDGASSLQTLETTWMKQLLARRRWQRWYNAVRATQRIRKLSAANG